MVLVGTGTMSYEIQFREIQSRPIDCHRKLWVELKVMEEMQSSHYCLFQHADYCRCKRRRLGSRLYFVAAQGTTGRYGGSRRNRVVFGGKNQRSKMDRHASATFFWVRGNESFLLETKESTRLPSLGTGGDQGELSNHLLWGKKNWNWMTCDVVYLVLKRKNNLASRWSIGNVWVSRL